MSIEEKEARGANGHLSRRGFLRLAAVGSAGYLLSACSPSPTAPAAVSSTPTTVPAAQPTRVQTPVVLPPTPVPTVPATPTPSALDRLVAAAKQEGSVVVAGPPGDLYRKGLTAFSDAYPGINVVYQGASGRDFGPKLIAEREAGQYLVDVHIGGPTTGIDLKNKGVFDSIKPLLLPEVVEDARWLDGFAIGYLDKEKQYIYGFEGILRPTFYVNRDVVPASELNKLDQLLEPKWKGRISWNDPRAFGAGSGSARPILKFRDEEYLKRLYAQDIGVTNDLRQQAEWIVRGTYPIAAGLDTTFLLPFQNEGLGKNVVPLDLDDPAGHRLEIGFGCVYMFNKAPHPNAAKLYLNWLLSKDGQTSWVGATGRNSRRLDVTGPAESAPDPKKKYPILNDEENDPLSVKVTQLAQQVIR